MRSGATVGSFVLSLLGTLVTMALEPMLQQEADGLSEDACTARQLMPFEQRDKPMAILDGERRGETVNLRMRPGEDGRWVQELGDLHTMVLSRTDSGDVVLHRLVLPTEGMEIVYEDAVTLLPARCHVEGVRRETTTATVTDIDTGEIVGDARVEHAIYSVSKSRLDLPAGELPAFVTDIEQTLDMDAADVTVRLESAFHPQRGEIYRRQKTHIEKLGLFGETHSRAVGLTTPEHAGSG